MELFNIMLLIIIINFFGVVLFFLSFLIKSYEKINSLKTIIEENKNEVDLMLSDLISLQNKFRGNK